jgi:hypothetical protein
MVGFGYQIKSRPTLDVILLYCQKLFEVLHELSFFLLQTCTSRFFNTKNYVNNENC